MILIFMGITVDSFGIYSFKEYCSFKHLGDQKI